MGTAQSVWTQRLTSRRLQRHLGDLSRSARLFYRCPPVEGFKCHAPTAAEQLRTSCRRRCDQPVSSSQSLPSRCCETYYGGQTTPGQIWADSRQQGHDVDLDTESRGVVVIVIHSARDLYDTDAFSKSDPYVAVTFSKLGKTL